MTMGNAARPISARQLFHQEQVRVLEPLHRHHCRGAVDHHDAGAHEEQRGGEEQLVRFELSRHTPRSKKV